MNDMIEINSENIKDLIYTIRGKQVMIDSDLALIYNYQVKRLNEQVKRNIKRFPKDFMFQLTRKEFDFVKSQFATSRKNNQFTGQSGGRRKLPFVFTEQGIYMLATVLKGEVAEKQSIFIMRSFREMRSFMTNNHELFSRLDRVELKQLETDKKFKEVFAFMSENKAVSQKIFFNGQIYDAFSLLVDIVRKADKTIVLIDNYVGVDTLNILAKKKDGVKVNIYTTKKSNLTESDIKKFNMQYKDLIVKVLDTFHDRFLILDNKTCYHIGASLKDAGKKSFAISKIEDKKIIKEILNRL